MTMHDNAYDTVLTEEIFENDGGIFVLPVKVVLLDALVVARFIEFQQVGREQRLRELFRAMRRGRCRFVERDSGCKFVQCWPRARMEGWSKSEQSLHVWQRRRGFSSRGIEMDGGG